VRKQAPVPKRQAPTVPDEPGVQDQAHTLAELLAAMDPDDAQATLAVLDDHLRRLRR